MGDCAAPRHGTKAAYMWARCRCPDAREDYRLYRKRRREGRAEPAMIDGTGTGRRLRALVAFGYTWADIGRRLGIDTSTARRLGVVQRPTVSRSTAAKVAALYDALSNTPGGRSYAYTTARKNGWPPPLAWDDGTIDDPDAHPNLGADTDNTVDEVLVDRVLRGWRPFADLNAAEQVALWRAWTRKRREGGQDGPGLNEFCRLHGMSKGSGWRLVQAAAGLATLDRPIQPRAAAAA